MSEELRGTKIPYELLALNFDTLMDDYVKLKEELKETFHIKNVQWRELQQLKSTLDEIRNYHSDLPNAVKKALAKHEDKA